MWVWGLLALAATWPAWALYGAYRATSGPERLRDPGERIRTLGELYVRQAALMEPESEPTVYNPYGYPPYGLG